MKGSIAQILSVASVLATPVSGTKAEQCLNFKPLPEVSTFLGAKLDYSVADNICCNNHNYAEYEGYLEAPEVDLFGRLDPKVEMIWYDSVCGIPLFIAPRGRTFDEFKRESILHGWPSFRPDEIVSENVIIHEDGRMESRCLTHLGHNLPKGGIDRYCIDLVCVAGSPLSPDDDRVKALMDYERAKVLTGQNSLSPDDERVDIAVDRNVITADELDPSTYVSSAEDWSGKYNDVGRKIMIGSVTVVSVLAAGTLFYFARNARNKQKRTLSVAETKGIEEAMA